LDRLRNLANQVGQQCWQRAPAAMLAGRW